MKEIRTNNGKYSLQIYKLFSISVTFKNKNDTHFLNAILSVRALDSIDAVVKFMNEFVGKHKDVIQVEFCKSDHLLHSLRNSVSLLDVCMKGIPDGLFQDIRGMCNKSSMDEILLGIRSM